MWQGRAVVLYRGDECKTAVTDNAGQEAGMFGGGLWRTLSPLPVSGMAPIFEHIFI